jgi:alkanesulfonate monooxygenase
VAARTTTFKPLIAVRPGYWQPAHFASAAATLDRLSGGRVLVNIVSGRDNVAAYGDTEGDQPQRYARTKEFMQLVRRLWTEERVTFTGEYFSVVDSTVAPRPHQADAGQGAGPRRHPRLYFGGASPAAERVSAAEADVQLFWGEPLAGVAERIDRLGALSDSLGRRHAPLEYGLRITTLVRDTAEEAWRDAEAKVAKMSEGQWSPAAHGQQRRAVGQQRLLDLAERGEVLDSCLYTAPGRFGAGGAGTTWLVGSPDDVADALRRYRELGITHFILSDTPYRQEIVRLGDQLLSRLAEPDTGVSAGVSAGDRPGSNGRGDLHLQDGAG